MPKKEEIASVKNDKSDSEPIDTRKEVAKLAGVPRDAIHKRTERFVLFAYIITIARTIYHLKKMLFYLKVLQIILICCIIQS